ncbi:MAG: TetR/AcrR family transcriptional regulator [Hyphomicrobiales bacterium]|nr:TetR/AcrR family transcriptional regulator [Hyphomicrobiales bacterium]
MADSVQRKPRARRAAEDSSPRSGERESMRDLVSQLKRDRIVSAAVDLFYRQGYAGTTLDEVAKALGMTKPFIYQYFGSKNDLLAEICSRAIRHANDALNRLLSQQGSPSDKLSSIVCEFILSVLNNQANAVIYSREETELAPKDREMIRQLRRDFDRRVVALLEEGIARGEFAIADVRVASFAIASMVGWAPVWFRAGGRLTKEEAADRMAALALSMVEVKRAATEGPRA